MYDIIGDIHGYADPLRRLLKRLGYREVSGVWQHPERKVIFLGDFIDRGPEQVEVVRIARHMVERGNALTVIGNHEFNAVAWAMPHPTRAGTYLRPHNDKNRNQHRAFLEQVGEGSHLHSELIDWFKTLPLFLDLDGLRVIHACWHTGALSTLKDWTDDENRILPHAWPILTQKGTAEYEALETVLKGLEIPLPSGYSFLDKDHVRRDRIRTQWWNPDLKTYRDLAMVPPEVIESVPHEPVPADILPGYAGDKPLFVGHYWLTGEPAPLNPHIACLDYSIAAKNTRAAIQGKLCAYRWSGERILRPDAFVWVS